MKRKKLWLTAVAALLLLVALALPALAQDVVRAEVDRSRLTTDETLLLTVAVDMAAGDPAAPALPTLDGFELLGSVQGTQISIVNGDMSRQTVFQYRLRPTQTGTLTIPPISVSVNGQTYATEAIAVEVTQGTGRPAPANPGFPNFSMPGMPNLPNLPNLPSMPNFPSLPTQPGNPSQPSQTLDPAQVPPALNGQDFFATAAVDKTMPYQGEQVVYTFRFYQAVELFEQPDYQPPSFTGLWSEQVADQIVYEGEVNGRNYRMTEVKTVLFPTVVGEITIDPAKLVIPGGFFNAGQTLSTEPIALTVRPLPAGAPADFQGAVGQFDVTAAVDTAAAQVGETVTLHVTISGQGNLETLADPAWQPGPQWRAFDSQATVETDFIDGKLQGTRTYEQVLVPTAAGELTLPAIRFSYFNPETGAYETAQTQPTTVQVAGDAGGDDSSNAQVAPVGGAGESAAPANLALRPNKAAPGGGSGPLTGSPIYWLLWLAPLLVLAGHFGWQRVRASRRENADVRRSQRAADVAQRALKQAERQPESATAAGDILVDYLSARLGRPVAGLSHTRLDGLLREQGVDAALSERVQACLARSEMARYAPAETPLHGEALPAETAAVIDALEAALPPLAGRGEGK